MFLVIPESILIHIDNGVAGYFFFKTTKIYKSKNQKQNSTTKNLHQQLQQNYYKTNIKNNFKGGGFLFPKITEMAHFRYVFK
jgi:hypothetical protein